MSTVAGVCGTKGLVDGPLTVNLLNKPQMVGVDAQGYLFIYDAGNGMIRMMDPTGQVTQMIDGTCRLDPLASDQIVAFNI